LCEKGMFYFDRQQYLQALAEFKKALLANPESELARAYIDVIEDQMTDEAAGPPGAPGRRGKAIDLSLEEMERRFKAKPLPKQGRSFVREQTFSIQTQPEFSVGQGDVPEIEPEVFQDGAVGQRPSSSPEQESVVALDLTGQQGEDIQLFMGESVLLKGFSVRRHLVTHPAILEAASMPGEELLLKPLDMGNAFLHVWNEQGERKSYRIVIGPRRFDEAFLQEEEKRVYEESLPESFKFGYSISGDTYMTGRGAGDLSRTSHTLAYTSSVTGQTPYGRFDSSVQANRTNAGIYRVSNVRLGLSDAHFDQFKDIDIRGFDFSSTFSAFGFPSSDLRGIRVDAPMFHKALEYSAFWGAVPLGDFTFLSPDSGLSKTKKAWLEGIGIDYKLSEKASLKTFYAHSYGSELNDPVLTNDTAGFQMDYDLGAWDFGTGMVSDMTHISYTAATTWTTPKLRMNLNMTDNAKNFASLLGGIPTSGSTAGTLSFHYKPVDKLTVYNAFSVDRDKVFNNPLEPGRPNYNSTTRISWALDPHTELEGAYIMDDQVGTNTPSVTETKEMVLRKKFFLIRRMNAYLMYQNRKSKNYTSPAQNYNNNRVLTGLNFRVLGDLYFYYNQEWNILYNTFSGESAMPMAQEYGVNFNKQIFQTPFYTNMRLFYRDEQNTESVLSYLSGEDRLEGEVELTYKPSPGNETFFKMRIDDVWAEKEGVNKHFDLNLTWGVRLLWDTGLRWQSSGGFYGYLYYDANADGIRQPEEEGVSGVRVIVNGKKDTLTNREGYYQFDGVSGKKAVISLDLSTLPKGYNPTVSAEKPVEVVHARRKRHDFGLATRVEISGLVFYDQNKNGVYDAGEETLKGVVLILDGKTKTATSLDGTYMFRRFSPGEHVMTLDLKSIPVQYIPKVPIRKTIHVLEGTTFVYHVPLERQEQSSP